jgi:hypothetical protein
MAPKEPPRKHYAEHYPLVMQRAGLTKGDDRAREFNTAVFTIFNSYWDARNQATIAGFQEVLARYAKGQARNHLCVSLSFDQCRQHVRRKGVYSGSRRDLVVSIRGYRPRGRPRCEYPPQ